MRSFLLPFAAACFLFACSSEGDAGGAKDDGEVIHASEVALSVAAEPLKSFSYDTGLIPAGSPAQVQLKLSAGGGIRVEAAGIPSAKGLEGKKGSGKVAVDLHVKLDGRLKVESALGSTDGDLPGLEDIDIAIKGDTSFDPFLLGEEQEAKLDTKIPAGDLPEIPLGATPGKLRLAIVDGSVLHSRFHGSCVSVAREKATYAGDLTTDGRLVLKGTLVVDVAGFGTEVDLGTIEVPIPELTTNLDFASKDAKGAKDASEGGKCGGGAASPSPTSPGAEDRRETPKPSDGVDAGSAPTAACGSEDDDPGASRALATSLAWISDTETGGLRRRKVVGTVNDVDVDWFELQVRDEGLNGNPTVRANIDGDDVNVDVFYRCNSGASSSTCATGTVTNEDGLGGCSGTTVSLATSCPGTNESGDAYVRVSSKRKTCQPYTLLLTVE